MVFLLAAFSGQPKNNVELSSDNTIHNSKAGLEVVNISPPLIPHTTAGFFPIQKNRNICLECHMPDKAEDVGAVPMPQAHFSDTRPSLILVNGVYQNPSTKEMNKKLGRFNFAYFNCSQCHVPADEIDVDISDLLTPELIKKFGLPKPVPSE